jgi:hypothetical protein
MTATTKREFGDESTDRITSSKDLDTKLNAILFLDAEIRRRRPQLKASDVKLINKSMSRQKVLPRANMLRGNLMMQ